MDTFKSVFFAEEGEKGITETSAAHICAIASNQKDEIESSLKDLSFYDVNMKIIGSDAPAIMTKKGCSSDIITTINDNLHRISLLNGLISWFAEARNAIEKYKEDRGSLSIEGWSKEKGIEIPSNPRTRFNTSDIESSTIEDIINELNPKDRQIYLALEAEAAVLGKMIHPKGALAKAREQLYYYLNNPLSTSGEGRDTLIYQYIPSVELKLVEDKFLELQAKYRTVEQSLNHMKSNLRKQLDSRIIEENNQRRIELNRQKEEVDKYNHDYKEIVIQYNQFLQDEITRISKIKFRIPEAYVALVDELNSLGK